MQENVTNVNTEEKLIECMTREKGDAALKKMLHIIGGPFSYSKIWKYKNFFTSMQDNVIRNTQPYCVMMAVLKMLEFDLPGARIYQKEIAEESFASYYLWAVMPETEEQWKQGMDRVISEYPNEIRTHHITLGRPSLYNGIWCMANFGQDFAEDDYLKELYVRCFGERGQGMYELLLAERFYQKNECFNALSLGVANSYPMERTKNMSSLFVALYIQMCVMIVTGQLRAVQYVMDKVSERVAGTVSEELRKNVKALASWCALYDRNYSLIEHWVDEDAPNEYGGLCLLDLFSYMVKLRVYLMQKKYFALWGLAESLLPLLKMSERKMDYCEVSIITALSLHAQEKTQEAFLLLDEALTIAEEYKFYRLVADEGEAMYRLLREYKRAKRFKNEKFLDNLITMSQQMGILFPGYMERGPQKEVELTEKEIAVLRQIAEQRSNGEIAEYLDISLNTVKYYTKHIYGKLGVKSRTKAVKMAKELGIL